ncbi:MAG TPA: NAD(P)-dependent alcohol dehydrogenase [Chthoniobacterales bacterium]|jgi:NADPH:quinone reductase-like Zn-dependent oxidoreductase|nr:NAD(P)-dependent alcohol dehydrogenase [Chthoniobacterales bacterium]
MKLKRIIKGTIKWTIRVVLVLLLLVSAWLFIAYWRSTNDCESLLAAPGARMKAVIYCDYGEADVLHLAEIAKPVPNDNQLLVRVRAASVNPYDWHFIRGTPYLMRLGVGLRKPKNSRLGVDFAGTVEAVGKNVTEFKPGDEVYGGKTGAFAQYICVSEKGVVRKPENLTFEQAGSVQIAGMTALQALRKFAHVQPGQRVLINGASGGVGTFAVQIGKALGAHVTGVCSGRNADMVRSLGADEVIDYTKQDFAQSGKQWDVILDNVPNHSLSDCRHSLTAKGKYIMIGGGGPEDGRWIGPFARVIKLMLLEPFVNQEMRMMMSDPTKDDMTYLRDLMQSGKVTPVIDRRFSLGQVPEAIWYLEKGHARGKVVITVD